MDIIVLIKQTVDMDQIKLNENNEPIMDNLPLKMDILSKNAVEAAVQLKEKYQGKITGIIFGTDRSTSTMKEAYAMGVDDGFILTGYKKSDPMVTSKVLTEAASVTTEGEKENVTVETKLPAVVSVAQEINEPRLPKVMQIMMAGKKNITIEDGKPQYEDDSKIISDKAPESQRKRIIYEDDSGIDEIAKILKVVR